MKSAFLAVVLGMSAAPVVAECRLALALGLDVSASVDQRDYALQMGGLARALLAPQVAEAILTLPSAPIDMMVFEWSGPNDQRVILPWTTITDRPVLTQISARLHGTQRGTLADTTAIGAALSFGATTLAERSCWRRVLDLSGDGRNNAGPRPHQIATSLPITVNGLVITPDRSDHAEIGVLWSYFTTDVVRGPNAFVEVAVGFEDFEAAMTRKLLREIGTLAVSSNTNGAPTQIRQ